MSLTLAETRVGKNPVSSNCTVMYAWIWQPHESMVINRRVCDDYLTVADLLASLVFVFHQNSHEPNRGCSMTIAMKDNVSEGNKERSNCFKNSNYMDHLAARSKCRSVWNCESHFATEIRPICAKNGWLWWSGEGGISHLDVSWKL